jgi:hypothetical protein
MEYRDFDLLTAVWKSSFRDSLRGRPTKSGTFLFNSSDWIGNIFSKVDWNKWVGQRLYSSMFEQES